ncbi:MAG: acyl-CoA dehydratase activase-related protein [candidate division WOR-3 bacterium]
MRASFPHFGYDTWVLKAFVEDLGASVVLPPPTSKRTVELGMRYGPELICMPFKITLGNFIEALEKGADTLFMAAGARKCRFGYYHFLQDRVLKSLNMRYRLVPVSQYSPYQFIFRLMPSEFGVSSTRVIRAVMLMFARSRLTHEFRKLLNRFRAVDFDGAEQRKQAALRLLETARSLRDVRSVQGKLRSLFALDGRSPDLRIGLVGEIFFTIEQFANHEIEKELARMGVEVVFERSLYHHLRHLLGIDMSYLRSRRLARRYLRECPGGEAIRTVGEALHFARQGVDGIVHVFPFTCMPENIALDALQQVSADTGIPVLSLSFDEHTSQTGLVTRLEAFVDLIRRRRRDRVPCRN